MSWARVDDQWWMHPKVLPLPMAARGLWTTALSYCGQRGTPVVPTAWLDMVAGDEGRNLARVLTDGGLWVEVDGGWEVHDWDQYQASAASDAKAQAGKVGGLTRALNAAQDRVRELESETGSEQAEPKQQASTVQAEAKQTGKQPPKHGPEPEPVPEDQNPSAAAAPRERDELRASIVDALRMDPPRHGTRPHQQLAMAADDLTRQGATPDQIAARVAGFRRRWPDATCTPMALAKHWPQLTPDRPPDPADEDTRAAERRAAAEAAAAPAPVPSPHHVRATA